MTSSPVYESFIEAFEFLSWIKLEAESSHQRTFNRLFQNAIETAEYSINGLKRIYDHDFFESVTQLFPNATLTSLMLDVLHDENYKHCSWARVGLILNETPTLSFERQFHILTFMDCQTFDTSLTGRYRELIRLTSFRALQTHPIELHTIEKVKKLFAESRLSLDVKNHEEKVRILKTLQVYVMVFDPDLSAYPLQYCIVRPSRIPQALTLSFNNAGKTNHYRFKEDDDLATIFSMITLFKLKLPALIL